MYLTKPNSRQLARLTKTLKYISCTKFHTCPRKDVPFTADLPCVISRSAKIVNKQMEIGLAYFINANPKNFK